MTIARRVISRRDFLKYAGGSIAVLVVGSKLSSVLENRAFAQEVIPVQTLDFHITDALKQMHTHNSINTAECYFWIYKTEIISSNVGNVPGPIKPECPGPTIMMVKGDTVHIKVTNDLDEPHAFSVPGLGLNTVPDVIPPGEFREYDIAATKCGAFLYYDNLNEPVNRMMGLHGAFIILPTEAERAPGHNLTPYDNPTSHVQAIFDAFGDPDIYPGLRWEDGDVTTNTPPFRHYLWLSHEASPRLFAEVGDYFSANGEVYPAQEFMDKFLRGAFVLNNNQNAHSDGIEEVSYKPQYFTFNGQSGFFSHLNSYVTPMGRVGEPCVVYILNAGLWQHSMHLHANHFYVTNDNGVLENPIWIDVFNIHPMDRVDYVIPFMRPPDLPNTRGIGRADTPRDTLNGHPCWPPVDEFNTYIPGFSLTAPPAGTFYNGSGESAFRPVLDAEGNLVFDINGDPVPGEPVDLVQRMSPLCYPMHDHAEPSQTTQGGNYNTALISGIYFTGDRNIAAEIPAGSDFPATYPVDFPYEEDWFHMYGTGDDRGCEIDGTHPCAPEPYHDH